MREILFRAWDGKRYSIGNPRYFDDSVNFRFHHFDIDCEKPILEQFTGLLDKHGRKIFEGDIVFIGNSWNENAVIIYDKDISAFVAQFKKWGNKRISKNTDFEVIGNIHDNAELLT